MSKQLTASVVSVHAGAGEGLEKPIQDRIDLELDGVVGAAEGQTVSNGAISIGNGDTYGYGWVLTTRSWANGRTLTHQGSNTLNSSVAWVAPERDFAVLALTNAGGGNAFGELDQLIGRLLAYYEDGS